MELHGHTAGCQLILLGREEHQGWVVEGCFLIQWGGSKGVGKSLSLISCHQGKCRDVF